MEANGIQQAFRLALTALRGRYESLRLTLVYTNPNPTYALSYNKGSGEDDVRETDSFPRHAEVMPLLAGKRMVFLNAFVIRESGVRFTAHKTALACLVSLFEGEEAFGYIIVESDSRDGLSVVREEAFLCHTAAELSGRISAHKSALRTADGSVFSPSAETPPEQAGAAAALRGLDGLNVDAAIKATGGFEDVYESSVRLFIRLLPETLLRMDGYLETDMAAFAIDVHGLKGSLYSIGAAALGNRAARIEEAAKSGDTAHCEEHYPPFREALTEFLKKITGALPSPNAVEKQAGDARFLLDRLEKAVELARDFDAFEAKNAMTEAAGFTYNPEADSLIHEITDSLERFDCESALQLMEKLRAETVSSAGAA